MRISLVALSFLALAMTTQAKQLKVSDAAPSFSKTSVQGQTIALNNYGSKTVLLTFFRFAGCPVCNYRMHQLMEEYTSLSAQNIEVIAVFESTSETLSQYIKDYEVPFPVISDPDLSLYKAYGVERSTRGMFRTFSNKEAKAQMKEGETLFGDNKYKKDGSLRQLEADFMIQGGTLLRAHYATFIGDHIPMEEVRSFAKTGADDKKAVEQAINAFVKAADNYDLSTLNKMLDPNFRIVMNQLFGSKDITIMDRATYLDKIKSKEFGGDSRSISFDLVHVEGQNASAVVTLKGAKMTFISQLHLVKDASGNWKVIEDIPTVTQ